MIGHKYDRGFNSVGKVLYGHRGHKGDNTHQCPAIKTDALPDYSVHWLICNYAVYQEQGEYKTETENSENSKDRPDI
jgi:hypothetical protein